MSCTTSVARLASSALTSDGSGTRLTLRDTAGGEVALQIDADQLAQLIDSAGRALAEIEAARRCGDRLRARLDVTWWNLGDSERATQDALASWFGAGGSLAFDLQPPVAAALLRVLQAHLDRRPAGAGVSVGFAD